MTPLLCHFSEIPLSSLVSDGWAFTNNYDINQHRSLEERLSAAQILVQKEPLCPVVVDEMDDVTAIKYGALPERLYVLQAGKVVYKVRSVHPETKTSTDGHVFRQSEMSFTPHSLLLSCKCMFRSNGCKCLYTISAHAIARGQTVKETDTALEFLAWSQAHVGPFQKCGTACYLAKTCH